MQLKYIEFLLNSAEFCVNPRRLSDTPKTKPWWKMLDLKGDGMLGIQWVGQIPHPKSTPTKPPCFFESKNPEGFFCTSEKGPNCSPVSITFPLRQPFERSLQLASLMTKWRTPFCSRRRTCNKMDATDSKNDWLVVSKVFKKMIINHHKCWIPNGFKYSSCSILHHGLCWTVHHELLPDVDATSIRYQDMIGRVSGTAQVWWSWRCGHFFRFASGCGTVKASVHLHDFCEA